LPFSPIEIALELLEIEQLLNFDLASPSFPKEPDLNLQHALKEENNTG